MQFWREIVEHEMNRENNWYEYDDGYSVGTVGSSDGAIVRDEEHKSGARITLEEENSFADFAITCGVFGWMFHTRFFGDEDEANEAFDEMKAELDKVLEALPSEEAADEDDREEFTEKLEMFVEMSP